MNRGEKAGHPFSHSRTNSTAKKKVTTLSYYKIEMKSGVEDFLTVELTRNFRPNKINLPIFFLSILAFYF